MSARITNYLNLLPISSGNIRNSPASLLPYRLLSRVQQWQQTLQRLAIKNRLRLRVIASHNIPNRSQRSLHNIQRAVHEQLHKPVTHPGVYDLLDLFVGSIAQIADRPARVRQHVHVIVEQKTRQDWQRLLHLRILEFIIVYFKLFSL